ncbi:hypothetical protein TIFTF001_055146 [Ficus carica]|uniref:Uncharacterized protein n=1 Tax=Ficus carica TaxID=3494 RepID=A0AA88EAX8_FICCA|nr:hypothetical protein TIFTF001_055146 [Ficus carica]
MVAPENISFTRSKNEIYHGLRAVAIGTRGCQQRAVVKAREREKNDTRRATVRISPTIRTHAHGAVRHGFPTTATECRDPLRSHLVMASNPVISPSS